MSIGLLLKARLKAGSFSKLTRISRSPNNLLDEFEKWVLNYAKDLHPVTFIGVQDEKPTLFCRLHPTAEDVELSIAGPEEFTASANTSTVGPGYHVFVCEMLHSLGKDFKAEWADPDDDFRDETGYFHSGKTDDVSSELSAWLKALANSFFDGTLTDFEHSVRLAMPIGVGFEADAPAVTPMGPRDWDWLKRTSEDPSKGADFFAWWNPGLTAEYFLGRALARMWSDVRWREPINDIERKTLKYAAGSLQTAYMMDPGLEYPWAEWTEILELLRESNPAFDFVRTHGKGLRPRIGYRRREVAMQLPGNWWITLPGSFSEFREQDNAFLSEDPPRAVWFNAYRFAENADDAFAHWRAKTLEMKRELIDESDDYIAVAQIAPGKEGNGEYFALTSSNICRTDRSICTVIFTDLADREWAVNVWKSLQPPTGKR